MGKSKIKSTEKGSNLGKGLTVKLGLRTSELVLHSKS